MSRDETGFEEHVKKISNFFFSYLSGKTVKVLAHYDSDGLSAASIFLFSLEKKRISYDLQIISNLTKKQVHEISDEKYDAFVFIDIGSGHISLINELFSNQVLVLDHHHSEKKEFKDNILFVNSSDFGIDGCKEICSAGVVYLFCLSQDKTVSNLAHLPLVGAIGDCQIKEGFYGYNERFLNTAQDNSLISIEKHLDLFGLNAKPLIKSIAYAEHLKIPGITGSIKQTKEFLIKNNIFTEEEVDLGKYSSLEKEKQKALERAIIKKREEEGADDPEKIFSNHYLLTKEELKRIQDIHDFSTFLNACGRLGKGKFGIDHCLSKDQDDEAILSILKLYKKTINRAFRWYRKNENTKKVKKGKKFVIVDAGDEIMYSVIGTLASLIANSNATKPGDFVLVAGELPSQELKLSFRYHARSCPPVNLLEVLENIAQNFDCEMGGHVSAAGAILSIADKQKVLEKAELVLSNL